MSIRNDRRKVQFPFQLSSGEIAVFYLPLPITEADAKRAGEFLRTVAIYPEVAVGQPPLDEEPS